MSNVIKESGGFLSLSKEFNIEIIHKDGTIDHYNYLEYLRKGDVSQNPIIRYGDRINIPYGEIGSESVLVSGAVEDNGYDIIEPEESLWSFIQRSIIFVGNANLDKIYISRRNNDVQIVYATELDQFILEPGDQIHIQESKAVFVAGFVKNPGRNQYFVGFSVEDYLGLSGGNLKTGDMSKVQIQHIDNTISVGIHHQIIRGDIIYVPQRNLNKLVGELSILQIISYVGSITLTYIAATR